jgi:hypothetical protein
MDKHLKKIAARALQTKFLRINASKSAFFVAKLKVKVLPSLVFFVDGESCPVLLGLAYSAHLVFATEAACPSIHACALLE